MSALPTYLFMIKFVILGNIWQFIAWQLYYILFLFYLRSQLHLFFSIDKMWIPTLPWLADLQANPFEYHDSYWGSCDPTLWGLPSVATGKVWLQQMWGNFGAILSEFIFRSEGWFLPRMPIKRTIHRQYWAGEVSRSLFVSGVFFFFTENPRIRKQINILHLIPKMWLVFINAN